MDRNLPINNRASAVYFFNGLDMAVVVGNVLLEYGLRPILDSLRSHGARRLRDRGLMGQSFRAWIASEMDDIALKLGALSQTHLFTSFSYLKQGVEHLLMSFDESTESRPYISENPSVPKEIHGQCITMQDAVSFAEAVGKTKISSMRRFESAKHLFEQSKSEATLAFHNAALNESERILATEVRVASGIFGNLDDPEIAASDCLHYLEELHNIPSIKRMFSVHIEGGIKAIFKKKTREEIVESVTMINSVVFDFISKFSRGSASRIVNWPMIDCGDQMINPIDYTDGKFGYV